MRVAITNPNDIIQGLKAERKILWNLLELYSTMENENFVSRIEERLNTIEKILKEVKL